jgi:hypothetical protein
MTDGDEKAASGQITIIAKEIGIQGEPILASYLELLLAKRSGVRF